MKTVAFVPIKLNNERLPNKNIKPFENGEPLLNYILKTLVNITDIDEVYVYCSNEKVCDFLPPGVNFLKRSENLDRSETKINEVISSFINDVDADIYILSHVTAPFVKEESIKIGIQKVLNEGYDSAFAVQKIQEFLWKDNKPLNYNPSSIARTQDLEPYYSETCGFYVFEKEIFENHNRRIGFNPYLVEVSKIESIDIDVKEDFDIANAIHNFFLRR
ncbi:acylneuraminate cytidylyltransferase family protein [Sporosarcina sp. SAFN-015]|uniref:acylneuraminate cytidylyltransferase family protein n=1 Tax=Sporosarcina sp. SAFN-015 TaxID=3387274 RepID=UPI003F7FAA92